MAIMKRYIPIHAYGAEVGALSASVVNPGYATAYGASDVWGYDLPIGSDKRIVYQWLPFDDMEADVVVTTKIAYVGDTTESDIEIYWWSYTRRQVIDSASWDTVQVHDYPTVSITANQLNVHTFTTTATLASLAIMALCAVARFGGDALDTYSGDINIWSVWIEYESAESQP